MNPTQQLHDLGQSLWLDNITRTMLVDGTLAGYIDELSVTGLTSNPTIFDKAISGGDAYDEQIAEVAPSGRDSTEETLLRAGARRPARRRRPVRADPRADRRRRRLRARWRSRRCSPTTPTATIAAGRRAPRARPSATTSTSRSPAPRPACRRSRSRSSPGSRSTSPCSSSTEQYLAAADAYLKGIERRIDAGLDPDVASVASLFMSRWDVAVADEAPEELHNRLGIAVGPAPTAPTASCSTRRACSGC